MAYFKRSLNDTPKQKCPCGFSRRPFDPDDNANSKHQRLFRDIYACQSLHGTIFTSTREALPHFHVPLKVEGIEGRGATYETYLVTHEDTKGKALIYLGNRGVKAEKGTVVFVEPPRVHGGVGDFTPLILGAPGFSKPGTVEIEDDEVKGVLIEAARGNIIKPIEYEGGLVQLTDSGPALSFSKYYGKEGIVLLVSQTKENELYCTAVPYDRLNQEAFRSADGPTYITVLGGGARIKINNENVEVEELDTLLLERGTGFSLDKRLCTAVMTLNPQNVRELVKQ